MAFMDGLSNGIGNAVSAIDRICTNIMLVLIVIACVLMISAFRTHNRTYIIVLRVIFIAFGLITIFCFQHEVQLYKTGATLLAVSIGGFAATFRKKD